MSWLFIQEIKQDIDQWNEHWAEINVDGIDGKSNISYQWVRNTLLELKKEGDILRQRAEDYGTHVSILSKIGAMFTEHAVYDPGKLIDVIEKAEKWDKAQELLDVLIRYDVIVPFEDGWKVLPAALNIQASTESTT